MWPEFKDLVLKYARRYWPPGGPFQSSGIPSRLEPQTSRLLQNLLRILPALPVVLLICLVLAILGVDFDGLRVEYSEARLSLYNQGDLIARSFSLGLGLPAKSIALDNLLLTVSVSGLIGYVTNWLAITMLFQPRTRRPVFGQGFIPAQKSVVIDRLARAITKHVINAEHLKAYIQDSGILNWGRKFAVQFIGDIVADQDFRQDSRVLAREYLEYVLAKDEVRSRIVQLAVARLREATGPVGAATKLYAAVDRSGLEKEIIKLLNTLPGSLDSFWDELNMQLDQLPDHIDRAADEVEEWLTRAILHLVGQLNMFALIQSNLEKLDSAEIERIIKSAARAEIRYIRYLGGVLGAVGGLVILDTWLLLPICLGLAVLIGLDRALVWAGQRRRPSSGRVSV